MSTYVVGAQIYHRRNKYLTFARKADYLTKTIFLIEPCPYSSHKYVPRSKDPRDGLTCKEQI